MFEENQAEAMNELLLNVFRCSCKKYIHPPIYQCAKGHSLCGDCIAYIKCLICKTNIPTAPGVRNFSLEEVYTYVEFPCRFTSEGCCVILKGVEIKGHEKQCMYRMIVCPLNATCRETELPVRRLYEHFSEYHSATEMNKLRWEPRIPDRETAIKCNLFKTLDGIFLFYSKINKEGILTGAFYEGSKKAEDFICHVIFGKHVDIATPCKTLQNGILESSLLAIPAKMYSQATSDHNSISAQISIIEDIEKLFK